jgi:hypothetical protein
LTALPKLFLLAAVMTVAVSAGALDRAGAVGDARSAITAADPVTCEGYPEKRVFLESQGWWGPMPRTARTGHVHVGTCFPHAQTVRGVLTFDVRVKLHENDGVAYLLRLSVGSSVVTSQTISMSCEEDCTRWFTLSYDTSKWAYDGRQELRLTAKIKQPDGTTQYQSTGWQVYFANGKPLRNYRSSDVVIARGWYTNFGYANATLETPLPLEPISGTWTPRVNFSRSGYLATIDADFHGGNEGTVVARGTGSGDRQLAIDTTKLANGPHKLVLVSSDVRSAGTNSGVQVIPFVVAN